MGDAATAACSFSTRLADRRFTTDVGLADGVSAVSLAGAALLWSGWTEDIRVLRQSVLVVRPDEAYSGDIEIVD